MNKTIAVATLATVLAGGAPAQTSPNGAPGPDSGVKIGLDLFSLHSGPGFNDVNPGVYIDYHGWSAGSYYNSTRRVSFWAGYTFEGRVTEAVSWGVTVGAISGYRNKIGPIMPLIAPSLAIDNPLGGRLRLVFIPKFQIGGAAALHFQQEWDF